MTYATDRESRLRRSLKRLGYDLIGSDAAKRLGAEPCFYIRYQGTHATSDLFGLSLDGVEA